MDDNGILNTVLNKILVKEFKTFNQVTSHLKVNDDYDSREMNEENKKNSDEEQKRTRSLIKNMVYSKIWNSRQTYNRDVRNNFENTVKNRDNSE